jgi:PAS domain S-box-containing protein
MGTVQDITEKKLIEIELRRHREELEELIKERTSELKDERDKAQNYLDIAGVIIMVLDENQNIILINKKGAETLGYDNEIELLGLNWYDNFIPENDREKRRFTFNDIFSETISNSTYLENTILTRTGETKLIAWKDTALRDHNNKIIGLLSSGEDITLRRKNEETLQERTKELEMFNKTMMGREVRIIELKEEVNALAKKLNKEIPYSTVWNQ